MTLWISPAYAQNLNDEYARLTAAIEKNPGDLNLKMDLAYLFSQGREEKRAIEIYESVIQKEPANLRATIEICALGTSVRAQDKALKACRDAASLAPQNPLMHDNLGLSHFKFGKYRQALKPFLDALALDPKSILIRTHLAQTYLALGEYAVARKVFEDLSEGKDLKNDEKFLVYYGLYLANHGMKRDEDAFTAIRETYKYSNNPLFLIKVIKAYMAAHRVVFFLAFGFVLLAGARYLGERLNRFLKNED